MITYRRADPKDDFEFGKMLHHAAYHDVVVRQFGTWDRRMQDRFFVDGWNRSPHLIVLLDGIPVGAVSFGDIEDYSYIHEIQILPEYQGRGIGSQFLRERIEAARSVGKSLKLKALRENKAKHLYLRMGFVSYEENVVEIKMVWRSPQIL